MTHYPNLKVARDARREDVLIEVAETGFLIKRHTPSNSPAHLLAHLPEGDGQPACGELIHPDGRDDPKRLPRQMPTVCPACLSTTAGRTTPADLLEKMKASADAILRQKRSLALHGR